MGRREAVRGRNKSEAKQIKHSAVACVKMINITYQVVPILSPLGCMVVGNVAEWWGPAQDPDALCLLLVLTVGNAPIRTKDGKAVALHTCEPVQRPVRIMPDVALTNSY